MKAICRASASAVMTDCLIDLNPQPHANAARPIRRTANTLDVHTTMLRHMQVIRIGNVPKLLAVKATDHDGFGIERIGRFRNKLQLLTDVAMTCNVLPTRPVEIGRAHV